MSKDVFIVHAPQDEPVAEKIIEFLEARGIEGWLAKRDFASAEQDKEAQTTAFAEARIFVIVFSAAANESRLCQAEAGRALESGKLLIPFCISSGQPSSSMDLLRRRRYCIEALLPPLEGHLEELFRIIKPFANQRKAAMVEASISRTMPGKGAILGAPAAKISREPTGPFQAAVNIPHVTLLDTRTLIGVIVANQGGQLLTEVQVEITGLGIKTQSAVIADLSPGTQAGLFFEITPTIEDAKLVRIILSGYDHLTRYCYSGSLPIRVSSSGDVTINMPRDRPETSVPSEVTQVTRGTMTFHPQQEHEVPRITLAEGFDTVDLSLDFAHSLDAESVTKTRTTPQIPFAFHGQKQTGDLLVLERMDDPSPLPHQTIRISARPSFTLGRSREEADYVLWFWPRNEIHDAKTLRISKKQCTFAREGADCVVRAATTSNITMLDGLALSPSGTELPDRGILSLPGDYTIEAQLIVPVTSSGPEISNLESWSGTPTEPLGAKGAVKFKALTPNTLPQQALWLLSEATFGTSEGSALVLYLPEIAEIQGRFHHLHGGFWLENCVGNESISVDGHVLKAGTIVPLASGKIIKIGSVRFSPKIS